MADFYHLLCYSRNLMTKSFYILIIFIDIDYEIHVLNKHEEENTIIKAEQKRKITILQVIIILYMQALEVRINIRIFFHKSNKKLIFISFFQKKVQLKSK